MTTTLRSSDGRVVVPARLRRRRVDVRRNQGRRRLRRIIAVAVLAGLLGGAYALLRSPLLEVGTVTIDGSSHVSRGDVQRASGIRPGVAMMDVSPAAAEKSLEAVPWVAGAEVSRQWPDRIEIQLSDRKPVAQVATGRSFAFVDGTGRVLQTAVGRRPDLPLLTGLHAGSAGSRLDAAGPLLQTVTALPRGVRDRVDRVAFATGRSVELTFADEGRVTLGRADGLPAKFSSLSTMLDHLGGLKAGCTLDVTVPASPTLTPEYGCA